MEARGSGPRWRRGAVALVTARVLGTLGAFMWIVAAASFGVYRDAAPSLASRVLAGASIGVPVLLGAGLLALAGMYLQRRR
jgi:hypothetical protein